ncbi:CLUMA_CG009066, isoform A [Clunio marinus]|uniref:CLUMA_CG009066, isoform A n=1 Tax=Clunio marinus TaxID=568069 RepID=A0A1J1I5J4_9DIPT|nr:CLUMA_CG009066, isoform A [Clunio marinus]
MWEFTKKPQISKFSSLSAFSEDTSSEILFAELSRMKKKLLLRSCKNVTRFTIGNPLTQKLSEEQLRTIASLLPDIAIASFDYKLQTFQGSILFADISGFTDLSDKYQKLENGASKLSSVLNTYLGSMVQEILSHDGDIIKFAGDAFIAVFKAENDFSIQDAIHRAMDTSLIIQNKCRNYLTEIGVILNVKISITCGDLYFSVIGEAHCSNYIIFGDPVWEAKALENKVTSGEILMTSKAMFFAKESLYIHQYNRQFRYFKLLGFKDGYEFSQGRQEAVLSIFEPELEKTISETSTIIQEISNELSILSFPLERAKDSYACE